MALAAVHHGLGLIPNNTISGMVIAHEPTRNWPKGTPARASLSHGRSRVELSGI